MKIKGYIFKAYDIRGVYPGDIDGSAAEAIGKAYGRFIGSGSIAVARDVRLSSGELMQHMLKGLKNAGIKTIDIGIVPTPVTYFAIRHYGLDGGIVVTASHNPPEWNGFKLYRKGGEIIGMGTGMERIMELAGHDSDMQTGGATEAQEAIDKSSETIEAYRGFLLTKVHVARRVKAVVDPGNGSYSGLAGRILSEAGVDVHPINNVPDGRFPARSPEPKPETLSGIMKGVVEQGADFGVAFDADGDRAIFIDEKGDVIRGDIAAALFIRNYLKAGEKAVYDVSCSDAVEEEIRRSGGIPLLTRVGRAFLLAKMMEENASIGGEISGHLYFSSVDFADDALFAALKMAELISISGRSLSQLVSELPRYEGSVLELDAEDRYKARIIDIVKSELEKSGMRLITIDGVKAIADYGWFILRASNTTPKIRLIAESKTAEGLKMLLDYAKGLYVRAYARATA